MFFAIIQNLQIYQEGDLMSWICAFCSTANENDNEICFVCGKEKKESYAPAVEKGKLQLLIYAIARYYRLITQKIKIYRIKWYLLRNEIYKRKIKRIEKQITKIKDTLDG